MKKILLLLLFSFAAHAQTTMKEVDIDAAAGNDYETLLTNREAMYGDANIQFYLQHNGYIYDEVYNTKNRNSLGKENVYSLARYKKNTLTGVEKQSYVWVKLFFKKVPQYSQPMTTKVEIYGDKIAIIQFYCNFWSRQLNFNDVKPGEVVSTRFLTDVATLSYPDANAAKIMVVTAKDRI
jgi:hypothetical protein